MSVQGTLCTKQTWVVKYLNNQNGNLKKSLWSSASLKYDNSMLCLTLMEETRGKQEREM